MNGQNLSPILITLFTALALYFPLSNVLPQSAPQNVTMQQHSARAPVGATPSTNGTSLQDGPKAEQGIAMKLLCEFFGPPYNPQDTSNACSLAGSQSGVSQNGAKKYQVEHIIATLPDPQDSRLDYLFDHHLDAMQRAIENTGYVLDRYSLPWEKPKNSQPGPPQVVIVPTQGTTVQTQPATAPVQMRRDYAREPGVMLFRQINAAGGKLLLLFLIGETPTKGIHKAAFLNALDQMKGLSDAPVTILQTGRTKHLLERLSDAPVKIRVLGPTFSGTAVSLALSLRYWLDQYDDQGRPQVQIISGSATAIDKGDFLTQVGHCDNVTFHATVRPDAEAWPALMHYLVQLDAGINQDARPSIAILSEDNTTYGQSIRQVVRGSASGKQPCLPDQGQATPADIPPVLSLTFPLHIAQLRAEVAKTRSTRAEITSGIFTPLHNDVPLPMGESNEAKGDVVPPFSAVETAALELVLSHILSAIHREPIRYIGLFATDVQDRIFLTRELRHHVPNTVLFTSGAELLYLHSEANLDFQGMLVITPYPLFSLNQIWSFPFKGMSKRLQFSTPSAQGCYNAMLALLGKPEQMIEYGRPFEPSVSGSHRYPVSWLSIVGRNGIWPVSILTAIPAHDPEAVYGL